MEQININIRAVDGSVTKITLNIRDEGSGRCKQAFYSLKVKAIKF